ncbi:DUF362 domain-containing protein [candidate division KSB1 bacterium]|nr:DUF362 domain-containing protein [candidate division KSB1 bacterium]
MDRREFLKSTGKAAAYAVGAAAVAPILAKSGIGSGSAASRSEIVVIRNGDPAQMVQKAFELLGGIERYVKKGQTVVVKPNIGWDRRPEQAANTEPELVAEVVRLCMKAGAAKVKVFDRTCNNAKRCYRNSGIEQAAEAAGADVKHIFMKRFEKVSIPAGKLLRSWEFYKDALSADVFINLPAAKHHSMSQVSLGLKNMMGILGGERGELHQQFADKIADINTVIKPQITILDAIRILMKNGPQGGNLADVKQLNTVVAGVDPVAIDAYGVTLFDQKPDQMAFLQAAYERGLGELDLKKIGIKEINL